MSEQGSIDASEHARMRLGPDLSRLWDEYREHLARTPEHGFVSRLAAVLDVDGTTVGVTILTSRDASEFARELNAFDFVASVVDASSRSISGRLPILGLPAVAELADVASISPIHRATRRGPSPRGFA